MYEYAQNNPAPLLPSNARLAGWRACLRMRKKSAHHGRALTFLYRLVSPARPFQKRERVWLARLSTVLLQVQRSLVKMIALQRLKGRDFVLKPCDKARVRGACVITLGRLLSHDLVLKPGQREAFHRQ